MSTSSTSTLRIPQHMLPGDGRFGCGPSKVPARAIEALGGPGARVLGTSHRQAPVKKLVQQVREGLAQLFELPEDYEVVLGNGGSTAFWDVATLTLVEHRSQHLVEPRLSCRT
ncbi:MAG: phosphoserine transaminase, partial [Candidatus Dormibacteria bacterium]